MAHYKKVGQSSVLRGIGGVLALLAALALPTPALMAAETMEGSVTQATPFDAKIHRSGALGSVSRQAPGTSADSLFFAARSFRYIPDEVGRDYWQTPEETYQRGGGDCEDKAVWLYSQLKQNGYQGVRLVIGRFRNGFHVWVTLQDSQDPSNLFILDPTAHKRIWGVRDFPPDYYHALYSFDGLNRYRHDG